MLLLLNDTFLGQFSEKPGLCYLNLELVKQNLYLFGILSIKYGIQWL